MSEFVQCPDCSQMTFNDKEGYCVSDICPSNNIDEDYDDEEDDSDYDFGEDEVE